ncbi:MAG: Rnase Y domain-containing protein, partial [Patescibacteria group bacterium]
MENIVFVAILALAAPLGFAIGYAFRRQISISNANSVEARAEQIIQSAKAQEKELLLKAKDKAIVTIEQAKKEENELHRELQDQQRRLEKREVVFEQRILDLEGKQEQLVEKAKKVEAIKAQVISLRDEQTAKLQSIAGLTRDEAKEELFKIVEKQEEENLMHRIHKLESQSSDELERRARTMLSGVMQRWTGSHVSETTTTMVELPSDEMKGRIIGKEGRNIKTIEQMTGVEIIVDDTPQTIMVSGFNPVRRHLAKRALDKLIEDGRIHPARIEEAVEQAKKELAQDIKKAGEDACYEVGVAGLDPKLIQILGRLKYRTSYGQNVLKHSIEVAQIGGMLAAELGGNVSVCKKGGLLHDIGKALDHEVQGGHPEIGFDLMKK